METLYRKYRPKNFSEVEGQVPLVRTLRNAIKNGRIGHAYLFTGPRGTGKTTIARIFSLALNCLNPKNGDPCEECESCLKILRNTSLSIIEIDAASHTGVDNIRQLRDEAVLPPMDGARYKIYIIDEVHMLSTGAFNALLKILEEPPRHIIFILATTEIQKVPETIVSRCQRFDFGRLPLKNIIDKLNRIAKSEKVKLDPEVTEMVAIASAGGMRDAESLLSQLFSSNDQHITAQEAEEILGFSHRSTVNTFIEELVHNNIPNALRHINKTSENGYNLDHFVESILYQLRRMLFLRISPDLASELKNEMTEKELQVTLKQVQSISISWIVRTIDILLTARISMKSSFLPQIPLETAVIKIVDITSAITQTSPPQKQPPLESMSTVTSSPLSKKIPKTTTSQKDTLNSSIQNTQQIIKSSRKTTLLSLKDIFSIWQQGIIQTQEKNALLGTFLKESAVVRTNKNVLFIETPSEFYKNTLEKRENRLTIEDILGTLLNTRISLDISVKAPEKESSDPLIQNILETFGNAVG